MAKVFPFKGIFYNKKKIKTLSRITAPPYDIIGPEEQDSLYQLNDFNVIRLILGKEFTGDNEYNNRYVRAAAFLEGWLRHKILLEDDKPSFYAYEQRFSLAGKRFVRLGFVGLLRLEDFGRGKVFPHEETYPRAKLDRLHLLKATNANVESIFAIYSDDKGKVTRVLKSFMRRSPFLEVKDRNRVIHRVWRINSKPALNKITQEMKDKAAFIADGHHRYEASLRYRTELKQKNTKFVEDEDYNHILTYFTPFEEKGLIILPIHRVVRNISFFDPERLMGDLTQYFEVTSYPSSKKSAPLAQKKMLRDLAKTGEGKHAFGLYLGNYHYCLLILRDESVIEEMVAEDKPAAWKKLDVTILHYVVFDRLLNIVQETEDKVIYTKSVEEAVKLVDEKKATMALFLNPTRIEEIIAIASKLEKMPHKSTYFYPKLLSGLLLNRFDFSEKIRT